MSHLIILVVSITIGITSADITKNFNCTEAATSGTNAGKLVYSKNAVSCKDKMSAAGCLYIFGATTASKVKEGAIDDRTPQCMFNVAGAPTTDDTVIAAATEWCPQFCGFCCLTPAYKCQNRNPPNIDCDKVTDSQCDDPAWRQIIADNCPNKCGFCQDGGCIDIAVDCNKDTSICQNLNLQAFVNVNCRKTCQRCPNSGLSTTTLFPGGTTTAFGCLDVSPNCASWNLNGFCGSQFYTQQQKVQYCARYSFFFLRLCTVITVSASPFPHDMDESLSQL